MKTLDFARKHLFGPLGIVDVGWAASPQGIDIGYGEMWLKPMTCPNLDGYFSIKADGATDKYYLQVLQNKPDLKQ